MKKKRRWRDDEEENWDVNGCSDEWTDVSRYGLKAKTPKHLNIVIFIISEAPLFSGLWGHKLVTCHHGEQINSGIREIWTKLCVIRRNILLYKLTVELFPSVSSCRISTSSISLNFACTCLQFRSKTSPALGNERGLEPLTTLETRERSSYVFNQSVVCFLPKNKTVRKTFHNMNMYCRNCSGNKAKPLSIVGYY